MQWLNPALVAVNGRMTPERPGGCIIYRPGDPHSYGADAFTPFGNNWFHFSGPGVPGLIEECSLPVNRPFHLRDQSFVEPALQLFLRESMGKRFAWRRTLSAHINLFFVEMARALLPDGVRHRSARNMERRDKFEDFRERLKGNCAEQWTLAKMAGELHLSVSRFSALYREFFDAKPVDDLIGMRITLAEYYLRTTNIPISYIANLCGFADIYYFSRVFKAKTGKTATAFRNLHHF